MLMAINRIREFSAIWLALLSVAGLCGLCLPPVPRGASDHRDGSSQTAGLCAAQSRQRAGQSRGLFGLAAGALLSGARARLYADGGRRHPGRRRGGCCAGGADRRPPHRAAFSAERLAIAGAVTIGAGLLLLGAWTEQTPTALRVAGLVVQGIGLGLFQLAYSDIVTATLPLTERGVAGSLALLTRTLGTVTAASVFFLVFEILQAKHGFFEAFQQTFQLAAVAGVCRGGAVGAFAAQDRQVVDQYDRPARICARGDRSIGSTEVSEPPVTKASAMLRLILSVRLDWAAVRWRCPNWPAVQSIRRHQQPGQIAIVDGRTQRDCERKAGDHLGRG